MKVLFSTGIRILNTLNKKNKKEIALSKRYETMCREAILQLNGNQL